MRITLVDTTLVTPALNNVTVSVTSYSDEAFTLIVTYLCLYWSFVYSTK